MIVLALCGAPAQATRPPVVSGAADGAATAAPSRVRKATVRWRACPDATAPTKECAWLTVPKVYGQRARGKVRIALARIPATGPEERRIGSLVWDVGGPGGPSTSSIGFMTRLSPRIRARFDLVAFDPRGMGASRPALTKCAQPWPIRPAGTATPNWRAVQRQAASVLRRANRRCVKANRGFVNTMGTNTVVRDLERLRAALGDKKLTFWGTSYGTRIGYVYASRYPHRVRAMVLDGNVDPADSYAGFVAVGGTAWDTALRFMARHYPAGHSAIVRTLRQLTTAPIGLADGTWFSRWHWIDFLGNAVPFQSTWPGLAQLAQVVAKARGNSDEARAARAILASWKAAPNGNEGSGFSVVNCLDYADRLSGRQQALAVKKLARSSPVFGGSIGLSYAMGCVGLGALEPDPVPSIDSRAERARVARVPVLVANATHDGETPMVWAKRMQRAFDRPMIRYRGGEHVIWGAVPSRCVNEPIDDFVISGKVPKRGRTCPFVPPTAS